MDDYTSPTGSIVIGCDLDRDWETYISTYDGKRSATVAVDESMAYDIVHHLQELYRMKD